MHKVTVVGAGNVGATCAYQLADRNVADVVTMIDIVEGMPQGKALDMAQCGSIFDFDARIEGSNDLAAVAGSDVVVVTSGIPRKPGMDRMDLLKTNAGILKEVSTAIKEHAPNAIVIVDTLLNFDDIVEEYEGARGIATYLFLRLPSYYLRDLIPITGFAAAFFCMGLPARRKEITALKAGGISPQRAAAPLPDPNLRVHAAAHQPLAVG